MKNQKPATRAAKNKLSWCFMFIIWPAHILKLTSITNFQKYSFLLLGLAMQVFLLLMLYTKSGTAAFIIFASIWFALLIILGTYIVSIRNYIESKHQKR